MLSKIHGFSFNRQPCVIHLTTGQALLARTHFNGRSVEFFNSSIALSPYASWLTFLRYGAIRHPSESSSASHGPSHQLHKKLRAKGPQIPTVNSRLVILRE